MIRKMMIAACILLVPRVAVSGTFELLCMGTMHSYDKGFGSGDDAGTNGRKIVYIDTEKKTLKTETFDGVIVTELHATNERYTAMFMHNIQHEDGLVKKETVTIDRYTGDASFSLHVAIGNEETVFPSFTGKCQKARKLF